MVVMHLTEALQGLLFWRVPTSMNFSIILFLSVNEGSPVNGNKELNSPRNTYNDCDLSEELDD